MLFIAPSIDVLVCDLEFEGISSTVRTKPKLMERLAVPLTKAEFKTSLYRKRRPRILPIANIFINKNPSSHAMFICQVFLKKRVARLFGPCLKKEYAGWGLSVASRAEEHGETAHFFSSSPEHTSRPVCAFENNPGLGYI